MTVWFLGFYMLLTFQIKRIEAESCDINGAASLCNSTCSEISEDVPGTCQLPTPNCCRFMCAGRATFCLVKGTNPDHLGFALVTSRKPCPMNGVCVKEPAEPSNWPSHVPWPPVQSWPHNYKFPADYNFPDFWPFMWQPIPLFSYPPDQVPVKEAPGPSTKLTSGGNGNIPKNNLVNSNSDLLQNGGKEVQVSSAPNYGNSHQVNIPIQGRGSYLLDSNSNINVGNDLQNDQSVTFKYEDADQIFKMTPLNRLEQKNSLKEKKKSKKTKAKYNKDSLEGGYAPTPVQYQDKDHKKIENSSLKAPSYQMQLVQLQNQTHVNQQQQQQQQQQQRQQHLGDYWQMEIPHTEPPQADIPWIFSPPLFLSQSYPLQLQHMYQQKKPVDQYLLHRFKKPSSFYTLSKLKHHHHKRRDPSLFTWLAAKKFNGTLPSRSQNTTGFKRKSKQRKGTDVDGKDPENKKKQ